jgi:hypothetical protein
LKENDNLNGYPDALNGIVVKFCGVLITLYIVGNRSNNISNKTYRSVKRRHTTGDLIPENPAHDSPLEVLSFKKIAKVEDPSEYIRQAATDIPNNLQMNLHTTFMKSCSTTSKQSHDSGNSSSGSEDANEMEYEERDRFNEANLISRYNYQSIGDDLSAKDFLSTTIVRAKWTKEEVREVHLI